MRTSRSWAEPDIAGVHDDERLGQAVGERPRIPLRPGDDGRAVRPVVDDRDAAGISMLAGHEPIPHRLADRHDAVRPGDEQARDALEQAIDPLAPEVAEETRHLGEHVLAQEDEARARAARAGERGQADDRRIRQRDDHVGPWHREPGQPRRAEVAQVVRRARGKAPRPERGSPRAQDPHAVSFLAPEREASTSPGRGRRAGRRRPVQRGAGHHPDLVTAVARQILGEVGEELARGALVRMIRAVEEADAQVRCAPGRHSDLRLLDDDGPPQRQGVHAGAEEAVEGLLGLQHDGLVLVERGVEEHGHARRAPKARRSCQ